MVCGSGTCTLVLGGICIVGMTTVVAGIGLLGFYLYRRNKKTNKPSTAQQ